MSGDASREDEHLLLHSGLAFFGALAASVSHELNNVISIVDQTAGLLQDMVVGEERGVPMSLERLSTAVGTVRRQTERGLGIIQRLNKFAHSADKPVSGFEVSEVMRNLVALSERLAGLKRAAIRLEDNPEPLSVNASPFFLQQTVFRIFQLALASAERDDEIRVAIGAESNGVNINIACPRELPVEGGVLEDLDTLASQIPGAVSRKSESGRDEFSVTISA